MASIGIPDIRSGGPGRVRELLATLADGAWVVVNATDYADLEAVACGVLLAERDGQSFLFRTGPSFVRALSGLGPRPPLRGAELRGGAGRGGHGLIVVGSHVGQTSRQLAALRAADNVTSFEFDVPAMLRGDDPVARTASEVTAALRGSDVLLYTSRVVAAGRDRGDSLAIARTVSEALARTVRAALPAPPAWVHRQGRHHFARHRHRGAGHPPRGRGRAAVSRGDLGAAARRCGAGGDRHALRGVRRQRGR